MIPDELLMRVARELGVPFERLKLEMMQLELSLKQPFDRKRFDDELRAVLEKRKRS